MIFHCYQSYLFFFSAKNGYYSGLVTLVRDALLADELVRIDCKGLPKSDYKKIGVKLRVLSLSEMALLIVVGLNQMNMKFRRFTCPSSDRQN